MEAIKGMLANAFSDQMRAIWNTWLLIQVLLFCFTISAIAAASDTGEALVLVPLGSSLPHLNLFTHSHFYPLLQVLLLMVSFLSGRYCAAMPILLEVLWCCAT